MTIGPHLLGRRQEHDPASRNYAIRPRRAEIFRPVTHTLAMPHLNQGDIGSCEGNTAMEWLGCAQSMRNRRAFWAKAGRGQSNWYPTETQALEAYGLATRLDEFPGEYPTEDTGTSGLGMAKAMQQLGAIWKYGWTFTWIDFLHMLQIRPIMLGMNWYDDMFEHDQDGLVHIGGGLAGGHAILAYAYRPPASGRPGRTGCTNHWVNDDGTPWGVRIGRHDGSFWIEDPDLERLLIREGGESLIPGVL